MTGKSRLTLGSEKANLPKLMDFALANAREAGLTEDRVARIELALEEVLVNVMDYACPDGSGQIGLQASLTSDQPRRWCIRIHDTGPAFDPLNAPDPDIEADMERRAVGGLGIHLVRQVASHVEYHRTADENLFTLCFDLPS